MLTQYAVETKHYNSWHYKAANMLHMPFDNEYDGSKNYNNFDLIAENV